MCRLHLHPEAPAERQQAIKRQIRDVFYVDNDHWRVQVIDQARQALFQAVADLGESRA